MNFTGDICTEANCPWGELLSTGWIVLGVNCPETIENKETETVLESLLHSIGPKTDQLLANTQQPVWNTWVNGFSQLVRQRYGRVSKISCYKLPDLLSELDYEDLNGGLGVRDLVTYSLWQVGHFIFYSQCIFTTALSFERFILVCFPIQSRTLLSNSRRKLFYLICTLLVVLFPTASGFYGVYTSVSVKSVTFGNRGSQKTPFVSGERHHYRLATTEAVSGNSAAFRALSISHLSVQLVYGSDLV